MAERLLLDTDVLIDFSRRHPQAVAFLRGLRQPVVISAITVAEMYAGVRDGKERDDLDTFVTASIVVEIDAQIAERGGLLLRQYGKSHGIGFADAVIAATAQIDRARLITLNQKHFPMFADLLVPYTKS